MKKILIMLLMLSMGSGSISQQLTPAQLKMKENLLARSRGQNTTGFIMLGAGTLAVVGATVWLTENIENIDWWNDSNTNEGETIGSVLLYTLGGASMVGSIFFFSAAARNKREAEKIGIGFKLEQVSPLALGKQHRLRYPAISLKWHLR